MSPSLRPLPSTSRYRVASCIASGGMGSVYVGIQRGAAGFKRPVAIKRAHRHLLDDPDFRDMILSEARNSSAVRHPNVVSVDDVEENDGEILLVMDYVEGTSLSHLLAATFALAPSVAIRIVLDVCAALNAIHIAKDEHGLPLNLVHRDVSPQNVLIDTEGNARLTDFGIARGNADAHRRSEREPPGKLGYMAPEYLKGAVASPQSDLFALGVVMWEALTGQTLFRGDTAADSLRLTLASIVPAASSIDETLPEELDAVIGRCVARDPGARFADARELARALTEVFPTIASRDEVAEVVRAVAGGMLADHRRAINVARSSGLPPRELPAFDLEEDAVAAVMMQRLAMPTKVTIVPGPMEAQRPPELPAEPAGPESEPLVEVSPPSIWRRGARSRGMLAIGVALVTFVVSSTVLIIELGAT